MQMVSSILAATIQLNFLSTIKTSFSRMPSIDRILNIQWFPKYQPNSAILLFTISLIENEVVRDWNGEGKGEEIDNDNILVYIEDKCDKV